MLLIVVFLVVLFSVLIMFDLLTKKVHHEPQQRSTYALCIQLVKEIVESGCQEKKKVLFNKYFTTNAIHPKQFFKKNVE